MEVAIKIDGQAVSVAVTVEIYEYLDQAAHKDEILAEIVDAQGTLFTKVFQWSEKNYNLFLKKHLNKTPFSG